MTHPETPPIPAKTRNTTHWKAVAQTAIKAREDWQRQYADEADRTDKLSNATLSVGLALWLVVG